MTPVEERIDHEEAKRIAERVLTEYPATRVIDSGNQRALARAYLNLLTEHSAREEALLKELKHRCWQLAVHICRGKVTSVGDEADRLYAASSLAFPVTESAQPEDPQQFVCVHDYRGYCHETKQAAYLCGGESAQPEEER